MDLQQQLAPHHSLPHACTHHAPVSSHLSPAQCPCCPPTRLALTTNSHCPAPCSEVAASYGLTSGPLPTLSGHSSMSYEEYAAAVSAATPPLKHVHRASYNG